MTCLNYTEVNTARKQHCCYWCGEAIEKGEPYTRWRWAEHGDIQTIKVHPECRKAWDSLDDRTGVPDDCYARGCTCQRGDCTCERVKL